LDIFYKVAFRFGSNKQR